MAISNNDILRRIRYIFELSDAQMVELLEAGGSAVNRPLVCDLLKKEDDAGFKACHDAMLSAFLNGFIIHRRGKKDDGPPEIETQLNNNIIFRKIRIALNLKAEDILGILALTQMTVSKHELSALFRRADHKHYRECKDQLLRNFLHGMQLKYRDNPWLSSKND